MTTPSKVTPSTSAVKGVTMPPSGVPLMGLAEAAKACGVSVSTLRRKRVELAAHGAAQTAKGWHIPITALIALGFMERTTDAGNESRHDTPTKAAMMSPDDGVTGELEALRVKLAAAEQRAAVAEAIAAERERVIQTQAMALRMLEAPNAPAQTLQPEAPTPPPHDAQETPTPNGRKHWWNRLISSRARP